MVYHLHFCTHSVLGEGGDQELKQVVIMLKLTSIISANFSQKIFHDNGFGSIRFQVSWMNLKPTMSEMSGGISLLGAPSWKTCWWSQRVNVWWCKMRWWPDNEGVNIKTVKCFDSHAVTFRTFTSANPTTIGWARQKSVSWIDLMGSLEVT